MKLFNRKKEVVKHSFPDLINKRIAVPQYKHREFFDNALPTTSYRITDRERMQVLMRKGAEKTTFDE